MNDRRSSFFPSAGEREIQYKHGVVEESFKQSLLTAGMWLGVFWKQTEQIRSICTQQFQEVLTVVSVMSMRCAIFCALIRLSRYKESFQP